MTAPVNTVAPAITGTIEVGETLSCSQGTWTGGTNGGFTYQWYLVNDSDVLIEGATLSQYVITALATGHGLKCVVTATNNTGSTAADSNTTTEVPADWFIVEDGTGKSDALSYVSTAEADDYHAHRGNVTWAVLTNGQKKAALVKATDYIGQMYRKRWKGVRYSTTQSLNWPRSFVEIDDYNYTDISYYTVIGGLYYYPSNTVPNEVKYATCELALRSLSGDLASDLTQAVKREKVDVLEVEYSEYSPQAVRYQVVDGLLSEFLGSGSNQVKLRRV